MEPRVVFPVLLALAMFLFGYAIIRLLNLQLPKPRNFWEFVEAAFWIYPESCDRKRIRANKIAWLLVVIATYITVTAIFS
jgi:hypothetical protein